MLSGVYELGSVIKAVTFAMAFDYGVINMNSKYDARFPLVIGSARINDFHAQRKILTVPEIFTNSSNIGTAKMALDVGLEQHIRNFWAESACLDRAGDGSAGNGKAACCPRNGAGLVSATAAFGHGFAVQPLQGLSVVAGILNNGKMVPPTFMRRSREEADVLSKQIVKPQVSKHMQDLFRLNATEGSASKADIPGYRIGGKTGTAEKVVQRALFQGPSPGVFHWRISRWTGRAMLFLSCSMNQSRCLKPMALQHLAGMLFQQPASFSNALRPFSVLIQC